MGFYQGVTDPLGGINSLWPLFGISNQMLAGIALIFATVVLFKRKLARYAGVTLIPMLWLLVCTLTAAWQKLIDVNPAIGFLTHANRFKIARQQGVLLAPATSFQQMKQIIVNDYVDATLVALFVAVTISMLIYGILASVKALKNQGPGVNDELNRSTTKNNHRGCC